MRTRLGGIHIPERLAGLREGAAERLAGLRQVRGGKMGGRLVRNSLQCRVEDGIMKQRIDVKKTTVSSRMNTTHTGVVKPPAASVGLEYLPAPAPQL